MKIISEARQIATNIGVSKPALLYQGSELIEANEELVRRLGRLGKVEPTDKRQGIRLTGTKATAWLDIDQQRAKSYLDKLKDQVRDRESKVKMLDGRLANKAYVARAPKKLVQDTKNQLTEERDWLETLNSELKNFEKSLQQ